MVEKQTHIQMHIRTPGQPDSLVPPMPNRRWKHKNNFPIPVNTVQQRYIDPRILPRQLSGFMAYMLN